MLAREPRHRYQTVSELIVDLERSQLAAQVPSFVDPARAKRDPIIRRRLASSMEVTAAQVLPGEDTPIETQFWYVRFHDAIGHWRKAKLTVNQIISRCRQGKIPISIEVSPYANGDFRPLKAYAEFREVADIPAQVKRPRKKLPAKPEKETVYSSQVIWLWIAVLTGIGIVGVVAVTLLMYFRQ